MEEMNKNKGEGPKKEVWDFSDTEFAGDKSEAKEKNRPPRYVYRGVHVTPKTFFEIDFNDDIVPPNPPEINEEGKETVGDGNEYGVYMTDYLEMAKNAYGNPNRYSGNILNKVEVNREKLNIAEPAIGVIYKVDTNGTDIHKPWITPSLTGHYNNGYMGDEWVTRRIPKENYTVYSISMGEDLIHGPEDLTGKSREEIKARYAERMKHIEKLNSDLDKLSLEKTTISTFRVREILKDLYGDDGAAYVDIDAIDAKTVKDGKKKLLAYAHHGEDNINLRLAEQAESLTTGIDENDECRKLFEKIEEEIQKIEKRKMDFVQRKKAEGIAEPNTIGFVRQQDGYRQMLELLK